MRAVPDERAAVLSALRRPTVGPPLRERVRPGQTVAISMCDGTRPQPRHVMIPAVLDELEGIVDPSDIVVLVATGTHRGNTPDELEAMLGADVLARVRVVNHDARDDASLRWCGEVLDVPVWLNREWVDADVRITTGFVEPHFFAGFSGGPKLNAPGLAGLETTLVLHNAWRIGDPNATWGITEGNPVHDAVRAIAAATGVDFMLDVLLDRDQRIVEVFSGDLAPRACRCVPSGEAARDGARRRGVRPRRHDELGLPPRPEPLPISEGDDCRCRGREARRHVDLRGGVPRRLPRPRLVSNGAGVAALAGRVAARDRGA